MDKIIVIINLITLSLNYSISLKYPFQLSNQSKITYIHSDLSGNYFVQLTNRTVVKYNPTLTFTQIIPYSEKIEFMFHQRATFSFHLRNGTIVFSQGIYQQIIYNNWTSISFHDYQTYAVLSSYNLNDKIIKSFGLPLNYPSPSYYGIPNHIVISENYINFVSQGQIYCIYNFSSMFAINVIATSSEYAPSQQSYGQNIDTMNINYLFYVSTSNNQTYQFRLNANFLLDESTFLFGLISITSSYKLLYTSGQTIGKMLHDNGFNVIIMQSLPSQNYYYFNLNTRQFGQGSSNLSNFLMRQVFNANNNLYILSTTGLIQINIPSTSLILLSVLNLLPLNSYELVFGNTDLLYIINDPNIYKAGPCIGEINETNCINQSSVMDLTNQNNLTSQNNLTFQTSDFNIIQFFQQFFNALHTFLSKIISVPGARSVIKPIFYLFGNFDNLFLYQYHDRTYNQVINDLFSQLNKLETGKWDLVNTTDMLSSVGNFESFYNFTNFQQSYQQFNYVYNTLNTGQSQGLFFNCQSYLIGVLPIVFVYFCIFHFLFRVTFNWSISKFVRSYQFWLFLLLIQLDGNIQQLTFYLSREWISIFTINFQQKFLKILIIYYGFMVIFASCSAYYIFRWLHKSKIKVVLENCKSTILSIFYATTEFGLKNIYFGVVNFFGRFLFSYDTLVVLLLSSQVIVIALLILCMKMNCFKCVTKVWLQIILTLLRVLFMLTLIFDYQTDNILIQQVQFVLIMLMISVFCFGIIVGITNLVWQYIQFFNKNGCGDSKNEKYGQELINSNGIETLVQNENKYNIKKMQKCITQTQHKTNTTDKKIIDRITVNQKNRHNQTKENRKILINYQLGSQ